MILEQERAAYIKEREQSEINIVAYVVRKQMMEGNLMSKDSSLPIQLLEELASQYGSVNNWLVVRTGIANARRKHQFLCWKSHVLKLSQAAKPEMSFKRA
jgi:hypothetical protein